MRQVLKYRTRVGTFYIVKTSDDRFHPWFDGDSLGSYAQIWQATEDLANNCIGSVVSPRTGKLIDVSSLGIPEDPGEWERV